MPGMCIMYILVFLSLNSKTTPMPWPKSKDGKRYKTPALASVFSCTDSSYHLLWSCLIWRKTLTPLNSYRKRAQEAPNTHLAVFAHSSVTTSSLNFPCLPIYLLLFFLNSVFFCQSTFLLSALMSSPSSCDVCRHNPALKNSLLVCTPSAFSAVLTRKKKKRKSLLQRKTLACAVFPLPHCLLSDFCQSLDLHPGWVWDRFNSYCTFLWTTYLIWKLSG